nr:unnamed protein product [Callosobruchus analis]
MSNYLQFLMIDVNNIPENLQNVLDTNYNQLIIILDGDCENATALLNEKTDKKYFYETYHWLVTTRAKDMTFSQVDKVKMNINADVNVAVFHNKNNVTVYDVYNPASDHGGELKGELLGEYQVGSGYIPRYTENKYWHRKNMTGVKFKSAIVSVTVNYCKEMYNFSLDVCRTNSWGYMQSDGRFDGLVGLLERRMVDFGSSPLLFKLDRMPFVDYGYGNWILRSYFIYRRPQVEAKSYEIFLRPLDKSVWFTILAILSIMAVVLKVIFANEMKIRRSNQIDGVESSWSFLLLFTLGAFCQQGATCVPKLFSSRIISIFVFLFCILVYQFYSASIQTTDPYAIQLYESKIKGDSNSSGFYPPKEGISLVRQGGFAFHVETSTAYPIIERTFTNEEICDLEEVQMYRTQPIMFKLMENGNIDRLRKYWDARKPVCIQAAKKKEIHVNLQEFSCGLVALCYGFSFSLLFLLTELVMRSKVWRAIKHVFRRTPGKYAILKHFTKRSNLVTVTNIQGTNKFGFLKTSHYHMGVVLDDITVAYPSEGNTGEKNYVIEEVYNPAEGKGGHLNRRVLGTFNVSHGYKAREKRCKYWVRRNMTGVLLKTTVVLPVPFEGSLSNYLQSDKDREINTFNRFHYNLMCQCENYYNFTKTIGMQKSWGYLKKDGTFDGLVGQLQRKQVDYGSSPLFVRVDRSTVMESAFIFRQPKVKGSADVFLKPLSTSIWILTLVAAALMVTALKLSHTGEKMAEHLGKSIENSWSLFVINAVAAFCQQGLTAVPYFVSGRIIILNLFVFSLLIYQFYSASLVSHLLIQPKSDIKTVSDILQSDMEVGCEDILYNKDYLFFLEPAEGIRLVDKGGYAFHVELVTGYPIIQKTFSNRHICELRQVPLFGNRPMHTNLQKHSPFRDMFDTW